MTWKTHVMVGSNSVWLLALLGKIDNTILLYLPLAALASLLPDIDATGARIHYIGHGVLGMFRGAFHGKYFHHRGIMHSIFITIVFGAAIALFTNNTIFNLAPFIFMLGYFSHIFIDGFNTSVGYLYPIITKSFALLPRSLLTRVNGAADNLLFFVGALGLVLFLFLFRNEFIATGIL